MKTHPVEPTHFPAIEWNWENVAYQPSWHEPVYAVMERYVPAGSTILEVGAGASHTMAALSGRLGCDAYGVEPNCSGISKASEMCLLEGSKATFMRGDGFALPFSESTFDVVYSLGLIEHFDFHRSIELVEEHARVCKPGGLVIVSVPNLLNLPHTVRKGFLGTKYEYYPESSYSPRKLKRVLESCGLTFLHADGIEPLWGLAMSKIGWKVCRVLSRLRIADRINNIERAALRSKIGFMTYAVGRKA